VFGFLGAAIYGKPGSHLKGRTLRLTYIRVLFGLTGSKAIVDILLENAGLIIVLEKLSKVCFSVKHTNNGII
jgi:hypothetical protein